MKDFNIVIPVSYKDCDFLKKTIPWVRKNIITTGSIYIITNRKCFKTYKQNFLLNYNVVLVDENEMLEGLSFKDVYRFMSKNGEESKTGWYLQQFLKIGFALTEHANDYYLMWDSDTIPLHPIDFFNGESILVNPKREHHEPYFKTITKLFGIEDFADYSFISEHMMIPTEIMKEMINELDSHGMPWWQFIISCCQQKGTQNFSEFETFGNYCRKFHPGLFDLRQLQTLRCGGRLFGRSVSEKELSYLSYDFDTASFERGHKPPFPRSISFYVSRSWIEIKHKYLNMI